jgi:glycosyltransferase involved in cell wall biosynthesis
LRYDLLQIVVDLSIAPFESVAAQLRHFVVFRRRLRYYNTIALFYWGEHMKSINETGQLISVVIPSRNRAAMLHEAVKSVIAQTHRQTEIIIVLTAADAATKRMAYALQAAYAVRIIETAPLNLAATRNAGLAIANGAWVSFLDDEDLWEKQKLERQLETAHEACADMVTTNWRRFDTADNFEPWQPSGSHPWPVDLSLPEALMIDNYASVGSLVRTDVLRKLGGFDEKLRACEDWDMWRRVSHRHRIEYLDEHLLRIRVQNGNMSRSPWLMYRWSVRHLLKMQRDTPPHLRHMLRGQAKRLALMTVNFAYLRAKQLTYRRLQRAWFALKALIPGQ